MPGVAAPAKERVIVVLRDDVADPAAVAQDLGRAHGFTVSHVYRSALKGFAAEVPAQAIAGLERNPRVDFIDSDFEVQAFAQPLPTGVDRIDADTNTTAGIDGVDERVDVDVAVINTGSGPHVDLNVVGGKDCTGTGSFADNHGHGSHVAGTIGALDNDIGVVGVAPGARIHSLKVLDGAGNGFWSWIICGIDYVTQNAGVIEIANMSLGGARERGRVVRRQLLAFGDLQLRQRRCHLRRRGGEQRERCQHLRPGHLPGGDHRLGARRLQR